MNLFFGTLGDASVHADAAEGRVSAAYSLRPERLPDGAGMMAWHGSDGGATLGMADDGSCTLVYLGAILGGAPGWEGPGSPLDDPTATASWLLGKYRRDGLSFLDGLPGTYILLLQDRDGGRALLATDPGGGHSLFVRHMSGGIQFASSLALMPTAFPGISLDRGMEDFLLGYQFLPEGRTVYTGVRSLPGGTLLEWKDGIEHRHKIAGWSGDAPDLSQASLDEAVDALHAGFMQALEDVAPSGHKVGVMLGGFDSALVAAGLRQMGKEVDSFTFYFADESFNQPHTDTLSRAIGSRHHWVLIDAAVIADGLRNYARSFNLPSVQPNNVIQSVQLCEFARRSGFKHLATGDGCDGLFLGYPTIYRRISLVKKLARIPVPLRRLAALTTRSRTLERILGHPYRMARNILTVLNREAHVREHFGSRAIDEFSLRWARGRQPSNSVEVEAVLKRLADEVRHLSVVRRAYHSKALSGNNRNKVEACLDVAGVSLASPYTHPAFAKLAGSLPDAMSRPDDGGSGLGKMALARMASQKRLLPDEIIYQAKRAPPEAPADAWYTNELRPQLEEMLADLPFEIDRTFADSLFSAKWTENLYRRRVALDRIASHALTALATYAAYNGVLRERDA